MPLNASRSRTDFEQAPHGLPGDLIVTLTSYPKRFACLPFSLNCLLNQSVKPDRVILWIAHKDKNDLPSTVLAMKEKGLSIRFCKDLRSYKKTIPALNAYPKAFLATADDDLYFDRNWLLDLTETFKKTGGIVCHRAHGILMDRRGLPVPYNDWEYEVSPQCTSSALFPSSGAGALYPPGAFAPEVLDEKEFQKSAPTTDDIWTYFMAARNGTKITRAPYPRKLITWQESQEARLWNVNREGFNDAAMRNLIQTYGWPKHVTEEKPTFPITGRTINAVLLESPEAYG